MPKMKLSPGQSVDKAITEAFKKAMITKHWTQSHLGKLCGMEQSYVSKLINNPSKRKFGDVVIIADKLGVDLLSREFKKR